MAQPEQSARLDFSTYFGGSSDDSITAVRTDAAGDIYVAGRTRSLDLFAGGIWIAPPPRPSQEVGFLAKIRADRSLEYSTYLERPVIALAVDAVGNAIVADNLPSGNRFSGPLGDIVVTKIDATGTTVVYSTRLGGSNFEGVSAIAVDASGSVVVTGQTTSANFPLVDPLQPIRSSSASATGGDAFITKLNSQGEIVFSTGWGGSGQDAGAAIAIDGNGDIVVAGTTASPDFVTTAGSLQRNLRNNGCRPGATLCRDAFIVRLSNDGQVVRYSTLYGGSADETLVAMVLDRFGSPHVTGVTTSADLPLHNAFQTACNSTRVDLYGCSAYVARLSPDGSVLRYATYFGSMSYYVGGLGLSIEDLAVDAEGNLVVVGETEGNDLPLARALQSVNGGGPLFKSTDDGVTWTASGRGLAGTGVWAFDSAGRQSLFARPLGGQLYRSDDQGRTWFAPRQAGPEPGMIAVDPLSSSTLYAASANGLLKSTDGGRRWSATSSLNERLDVVQVAPSAPSNIYAMSNRGVFHSPNAGLTWSVILDMPFTIGKPYVQNIAVDPRDAETIYAMISDRSILRRQRGQQWESVSTMECPANQLVFVDGPPRAIYALACGKIWKSVDQARTWRVIGFSARTAGPMFLDPARPNIIYVPSAHNGVYRSIDGGETWQRIREPLDQDVRAVMVDPADPRTIYIGATHALNAFVTRFSPSGAVTFGSYLGGLSASGHAVAAGPNGTIVVVGRTGRDFPMEQSIQGQYAGSGDGFIARILDRW